MAKEKVVKEESLQDSLNEISKEFGEGVITYASEEIGNLEVIPFGILSVDAITGIGGVPRGRVTEIHGMDGTFKTTFTLELVKQAQSQGLTCAFIDAEYSYYPEYAETIGVDNEKLILIHPASAEEALGIIDKLVETKKIDLIILDSIAALSPNAELQNVFGASNMGVMARLMGQFFRKVTAKIGKTGTTLVMLNQLREALGGYVPMKTTPAGNALRFYASLRFELSKSQIKEGTEVKGVTIKVKCVKNKLATPFLTTEVECIYGQGIDKMKDFVNMAIELDIIHKAGAGWCTYKDIKVQGVDVLTQILKDNDELRLEIEQQIKEKMRQ